MRKHFTLKTLIALMFLVGWIPAKAQLVTVGTGTSTTSNVPIASCMGYNYSQQIYTATEIIAANSGTPPSGQIITVRFYLSTSSYNSGSTNSSNWTIYLGNTDSSTFASTNSANWIPAAAMTQVFSGTINFPPFGNWVDIPLTVPFTWNSTQNLVVAIDENTSSWDCTMFWNYTSTSPSYRTMYYNNDNTNPNPASPPNATSRTYTRPNIQLLWASPCATTTLPSAGSVAATPGSLCMSGNVTLNFTPSTPMPSVTGITYKWQSSPTAGGTYTDIPGAVTNTPTYTTTTPVTANTFFKCVMMCGANTVLTSSASNGVTVNNPGVPTSTTPGSRCGPGTVTLSATPPGGSTINWYATPVGGLPIGNTNTINTPYITSTTTFYAAAASGSSPATPQIGTGTSSLPDYQVGGPFNNYYRSEATQLLYTAAELIAAGGGNGVINSIGFNCTGVPQQSGNPTTLPNYTISVKTIPAGTTTLAWQTPTSFTQVYNAATYIPTLGWNTFNLATPFAWNGVDNIVIQICYSQTSPSYSAGNTNGKHEYTTVSGRMMYFNDDGVPTGCGQTGTNTSTYLPNVRFGMVLGCEGARQPVVATVNSSPVVGRTSPDIVCNNAVAPIILTPPTPNYPSYTWTPVTDLYTNATATTPYTGGSATSVYMKSTTVGPHTFYMMAGNPNVSTGCTYADTVRIWVQPETSTIKAIPDTICVSGTAKLKLIPDAGYAPNSIQWQESVDGVTYNDIPGANATVYVTPTLTANHHYKAVIKSTTGSTTPCLTPTKLVVVANPAILSTTDSFNCGPGTVTLQAAVGANSGIKWYDDPTAALPVGAGSPFTTPYLGATDTFYIAASSGTPQPQPANVVTQGTLNNYVSSAIPLYYNKGHKFQYIIKASEIQAQGFTEGLINSLGFEVTTVNMSYSNISIQMKLTPDETFSNGTTPSTTFATGLEEVFADAGPITPAANSTLTFNFQTPFYWDGTSNIIIQFCHNNPSAGSYSNSAALKFRSNYNYPNNTAIYQYGNVNTICTSPTGGTAYGPYSSYDRPHTVIGMIGACESPRTPVIAYIRPVPEVDLGQDINKCVDEGAVVVLDAGVQPNNGQYLWDNGSTSQVRAITQSGTYDVTVTNEYTCVGRDTIGVVLRANPVVELGNDTSVCNGVTLTLNAGNDGIEYFWNTGQTTQTINVNTPGTYNVFVTNNQACTKADTITVNMSGQLPTIQGISITNNGQNTFHFTAVNPQNVIGYDWDFGDGTPHSYQASPSHTYANTGNYVVTLTLSSTCGFWTDSTSAHIVGINQINVGNEEMTLYPNPTRETATILNKGTLKMEKVEVYNVLGQVIYSAPADSKDKHTLQLSGLASGVYTVQIVTDKGTVARKLEIIK